MNVLVTGASGHIGYHICKLLTAQGYGVKAFIRPCSFKEHLLKLPLTICYGDILDVSALKKAMKNIDYVFHAAAVYKLTNLDRSELIIRTATEGTTNLYQAAYENRIKKIVYTSSVETVGLTYDKNKPLDETIFTTECFYAYSRAKVESEKIALDLSKKLGLYTVICNPSTVIGKNDYKLTPSNNMLLNFSRYSLFYLEAGQSLVDVEDVALGHINALLKGRNLQRYILSGENVEIKDVVILIREILGIKGPVFKLNKQFLYFSAFICEILSNLMQKEPFFTRKKVLRSIGSYSYYDYSKAKEELGYRPKSLNEILPGALAWLRERYR